MSWEGYYRYLCEEGHTFCYDGYDAPDVCPFCSLPLAWLRAVDTTNDEGDDPPLTIKTEPVLAVCNLHHKHVVSEATYHVPADGRRL